MSKTDEEDEVDPQHEVYKSMSKEAMIEKFGAAVLHEVERPDGEIN